MKKIYNKLMTWLCSFKNEDTPAVYLKNMEDHQRRIRLMKLNPEDEKKYREAYENIFR